MPNVHNDDVETLWFADESEHADEPDFDDDSRPVGLTVATIHRKWLDLGLPAHTWPAFLARHHVEHDMTERAMSDCEFGCKVFGCECGEREVRHMASYGCPIGRGEVLSAD